MAVKKISKSKKLVYLDYAATTPLDPRVRVAMLPFLADKFGNPSSLYAAGQQAKTAIELARKQIAEILQCRSQEIIFTAGGTESANLAIFGVARKFLLNSKTRPHIITSAIEHHAVLDAFRALEKEEIEVTYLPVDQFGFVKAPEVFKAVRDNTIFISIMYANNEIGTIQPIAEISKQLRKLNLQRAEKNLPQILFHSDACQTAGALSLNTEYLGVDFLTLNASKIYGPKQSGILYIKDGVKILPLIYGGGQERGLRAGTENVANIAGLGLALQIAEQERRKESLRLRKLRDYLVVQISKQIPDARLNGPLTSRDSEKKPARLPNNINFSFDGIEGESLLLYLDAYNIAVSTGSACTTAGTDPSHVILALGHNAVYAAGTVRITLGRSTTKQQLDYCLKVMIMLVAQLRKIQRHKISEDYLKAL